jgi:hypothetical protein
MSKLGDFPVLSAPVYRLKDGSPLFKLTMSNNKTCKQLLTEVIVPTHFVIKAHGIDLKDSDSLFFMNDQIGFKVPNFPAELSQYLLPADSQDVRFIDNDSVLGKDLAEISERSNELYEKNHNLQLAIDKYYAKIFSKIRDDSRPVFGFSLRINVPQVLPHGFFIDSDYIDRNIPEFTDNFESYDYNSYLLTVAMFVNAFSKK